MAINDIHDSVPTIRFPNEGLAVRRFAIHSKVETLDLLDDLTGNVIAHYDSSAAAVAGEPDVESATPTHRFGSGNYIEFNGQTDASEYMLITFATAKDLSQYNFIGFWAQSDTNTLVTDYDLELRDTNNALIASFNVPALTASVWQFIEIDVSGYIRTDVKYIKVQCDVADNDVIDFCNLIAYEYGNGSGPIMGICGVYTSAGAITRGDLVELIPGRPGYAQQGTDNDPNVIGKACNTVTGADSDIMVQETGVIFQRMSGTTVAAGDPAAASAATTADDDTTAGRAFGIWMEASATAGADLQLQLGTRGAATLTIGDHAHAGVAGDGGQLDWDNIFSDAVHDHSSDAEGSLLSRTDKQCTPDFLAGTTESGTWTASVSSGLPLVTRTSNNNTTEYFVIALELGARTTASTGIMITSVEVAYSVDAADAGDDFQVHVCSRALPANGAAPSAITTIAGDADVDYDDDHNTAAERILDTGAPENHTLTMTIPGGDQAYIADSEAWFLRLCAIEADDGTGALAIIVKEIIVNYTEVY